MRAAKPGRPRRYAFVPAAGIADAEIARHLAHIEELRERVADQIGDLPPEVLNHVFSGHTLTVGRLALHLAWAEYSWMKRVASATGGPPIRKDLADTLLVGSLDRFGEAPAPVESSAWLIALYEATRSEITIPICRAIRSADEVIAHPALNNVRKVLEHLKWHWAYHSGQIGLLTLEVGYDYTWRFEEAPPADGKMS